MRIILASKSPRRRELMGLITDNFEIMTKDIDEREIERLVIAEEGVRAVPRILAREKARAVFEDVANPADSSAAARERGDGFEAVVIGADTSVICGDEILGKPRDRDDARRMLRMLSGVEHEVITGVCVKTSRREVLFDEVTKVRFGDLDGYQEMLIEKYINTEDPYDKAGAYGIQQGGAALVESVNGDYFSVVGLPVRRLARALSQLGAV